ncbi:helix-turn-helix domain-containing protein [Clostridium cellulovorans]|uniref:Transposase Synechocystis PCC 6803 domain-containing protein n=1 Tax=Clostridium cellulovorans (strain ATCC 35296 / DSM 3052 / OCM 3 / 743B) TaxID=573061 RepID=D9SWE6_CLOC7|nr:helix-turn-helix domain-containing protein [Clostridium cellulovorans]ADL53228.1 hypothetical protein Clocel_3552 [Clostridium cellulovorans 743B]
MDVITVDKDRMIDMLLSGINITEIAETLKVSRQTIYAWKKETLVEAELERRRQQLKKTAQNKIENNVCSYIDNMIELANQKTDNRTRYSANKFLIEHALGIASARKEDNLKASDDDSNKDKNEIKEDITNIKNFQVV